MFAGCLQIMRAHLHLIRVEGGGYSQIIRAENTDVCRSYGLCLQAVTVTQLEGAGDAYHQAVLAANLHHKNEMIAYLRTVSTSSIAKTTEEQREIVQKLIREAVSNEITALKKALSESSANHRVPFLSSWGRIIICCGLTALIGSAITVELIRRLGIS